MTFQSLQSKISRKFGRYVSQELFTTSWGEQRERSVYVWRDRRKFKAASEILESFRSKKIYNSNLRTIVSHLENVDVKYRNEHWNALYNSYLAVLKADDKFNDLLAEAAYAEIKKLFPEDFK